MGEYSSARMFAFQIILNKMCHSATTKHLFVSLFRFNFYSNSFLPWSFRVMVFARGSAIVQTRYCLMTIPIFCFFFYFKFVSRVNQHQNIQLVVVTVLIVSKDMTVSNVLLTRMHIILQNFIHPINFTYNFWKK